MKNRGFRYTITSIVCSLTSQGPMSILRVIGHLSGETPQLKGLDQPGIKLRIIEVSSGKLWVKKEERNDALPSKYLSLNHIQAPNK